MAIRDTPFPVGTPCWVDLFTSDVEKSKTFYGRLFGWEFTDPGEEYGGYVEATADGREVAGLMQKPESSSSPDAWSTYLAADDVAATVRTAVERGAQVIAEPMAVGDLGSLAVVIDPAGALIGFWQAGRHIGFKRYQEPNSVAWSELHTKDFSAATDFYSAVAGWDYRVVGDTDDFRYRTAQVQGEDVAGVMDSAAFLPEDVPSHWTVYFGVADVDEAVATAEAEGATVVRPAEDTPFGRLVELIDPIGAPFKLHSNKLLNPGAGEHPRE
jgi:uncharacterized protein